MNWKAFGIALLVLANPTMAAAQEIYRPDPLPPREDFNIQPVNPLPNDNLGVGPLSSPPQVRDARPAVRCAPNTNNPDNGTPCASSNTNN